MDKIVKYRCKYCKKEYSRATVAQSCENFCAFLRKAKRVFERRRKLIPFGRKPDATDNTLCAICGRTLKVNTCSWGDTGIARNRIENAICRYSTFLCADCDKMVQHIIIPKLKKIGFFKYFSLRDKVVNINSMQKLYISQKRAAKRKTSNNKEVWREFL